MDLTNVSGKIKTTFMEPEPLIAINGAVITGACWGYRFGGIAAVHFDITFSKMGTGIEKFQIPNAPDSRYYLMASGTFGEKSVSASINSNKTFELYSDYGPGRYLGYVICFINS